MYAAITKPPDTIIAHYHHLWLIWVLFVIGILLHWLLQVWRLSKDSKQSMRACFLANWIPMLYRSFACGLLFTGIWQHPDMIASALRLIGHPVSPDEASVLSWPMNNVLAGVYGLALDSVWGYLPVFKSKMPEVDMPIQEPLAKAADAIAEAQQVAAQPPKEN